jgi:predicted amidohydrolase
MGTVCGDVRAQTLEARLPFTLAALSPTLRHVDHAGPASLLAANAQRVATAIRAAKQGDPALGIVVLPSGCFSGGAGVTDLAPAADWLAPLLAAATDCDVCIAGADRYDAGPGHAGTEAGFLIAPQRGLVRVQRALSEGATRVETFDSEHGCIAVLVGGDLLHPEYARLAMFAGAEILLNPCAERADERAAARQFSRAARAWENHVVVASCGLGQSVDADGLPAAAQAVRAQSAIWSHSAQLLVEGSDPALFATIDLASLRQRRVDPWIHFPAQLRTGLYAEVYARAARDEAAGAAAPAAAPVTPAGPTPPASPEAYDVLLMQAHQTFVGGPESRDATIRDNLDRALALAVPFSMRPSDEARRVPRVLPAGFGWPASARLVGALRHPHPRARDRAARRIRAPVQCLRLRRGARVRPGMAAALFQYVHHHRAVGRDHPALPQAAVRRPEWPAERHDAGQRVHAVRRALRLRRADTGGRHADRPPRHADLL